MVMTHTPIIERQTRERESKAKHIDGCRRSSPPEVSTFRVAFVVVLASEHAATSHKQLPLLQGMHDVRTDRFQTLFPLQLTQDIEMRL